MATSGTYTFNPSLGEITLYAYNLIGVRNTALLQEHMEASRMAANMLCSNWSNRGVNLWAVDLVTVALVQGQASYDVDLNTVMILDAYMEIDNGGGQPIDRIIMPVSRTEYASYPNKEQQGFTTTFWFDRLIGTVSPNKPTVTLWPVPDGSSAQNLKYYRVRQVQDAVLQNGTLYPLFVQTKSLVVADLKTFQLDMLVNPVSETLSAPFSWDLILWDTWKDRLNAARGRKTS
jgi:hypothetical protein